MVKGTIVLEGDYGLEYKRTCWSVVEGSPLCVVDGHSDIPHFAGSRYRIAHRASARSIIKTNSKPKAIAMMRRLLKWKGVDWSWDVERIRLNTTREQVFAAAGYDPNAAN